MLLVGTGLGFGAAQLIDDGDADADALTIRGTFTLADSENVIGSWDSCFGDGGYDDFGPGMNVTIRDGDGSIVGTGNTETLENLPPEVEEALDDNTDTTLPEDLDPLTGAVLYAKIFDGTQCVVQFSVPVKDAEFYAVSVGKRGELSYSKSELEERDWWVELTLGG